MYADIYLYTYMCVYIYIYTCFVKIFAIFSINIQFSLFNFSIALTLFLKRLKGRRYSSSPMFKIW